MPTADVVPGRKLRRILLGALAVLPVVAIGDILRPALFERRLFEQIALMRGAVEPMLTRSDLLVLAACGLLLAAGPSATRRIPTGALASLTLVAWASVMMFTGGELLLRLGGPRVYQPGIAMEFHPDPRILPGIAGSTRFTTNRRGMRGPEWSERAYKILAVGGSTTICLYLDDATVWPQRLMTILNERRSGREYWVGNVGKLGLDSLHHIELLRRLPEAKEADCLLILCGVNDLSHALRLPEDTRARLAPSHVFDRGGPLDPMRPYLKQMYLYRTAKTLMRAGGPETTDEEDDSGEVYLTRRRLRQAAAKDYAVPPLEEHLANYARNLEAMIAHCREHKIRCVFLTQPTAWQDPMPPALEALTWFAPMGNSNRTISSPDLAVAMAAFNQTMLNVCRRHEVECVDVAAGVPKDERNFYDDEHFTEAGSDAVARIIAPHFLN